MQTMVLFLFFIKKNNHPRCGIVVGVSYAGGWSLGRWMCQWDPDGMQFRHAYLFSKGKQSDGNIKFNVNSGL